MVARERQRCRLATKGVGPVALGLESSLQAIWHPRPQTFEESVGLLLTRLLPYLFFLVASASEILQSSG